MWVFAEQPCLLRGSIFIHLTSEWGSDVRELSRASCDTFVQQLMGPFHLWMLMWRVLRSAQSNKAAFFRLTTYNAAGAVEK